MLEEILTNKNTDLLKDFNSSCTDMVKKIQFDMLISLPIAFDMSDISIALALMRLDPISILEESDTDEDVESLKTFCEFYGNVRTGEFGEHTTTCEKIINCNEDSLVAEYKTFCQYITKDS